MKVYIQCSKVHHMPSSDNFYEAQLAFYEMGFDTIGFENQEELVKAEREDIVVGYVGTVAGQTILVEVNDGYALGSYGLLYYDYAKLLSARWAELTETEDMCKF